MSDSSTHFLVVNDEENKRRIVTALLRECGYIRVSEAEDGARALKAFQLAKSMHGPIDFLITGCAMPFVNGLELIRTIRAQDSMQHLPILMITDAATREDILAAVEAGADGYLVPPFKATQLMKQIDSIQHARAAQATTAVPAPVMSEARQQSIAKVIRKNVEQI